MRLSHLLVSRRGDHAVLSVAVQARLHQPPRVQPQFEVLLRHLFDRLLNNDAFGEDAALRVSQLAYAIVLPGILVALFLFPAYHGLPPHPLERPFWSQAADHLFYVTYALVVLGVALLFQWDLLFPDLLDIYVLSTLPISRTRLLTGRISALAVFLALVLVGTTVPTDLFFPAVADLHCGFWRHLFAHTVAVSAAALFAILLFLALGGTLACLPGRRLYSVLAPSARTLFLIVLLTTLFLFPLTARYLPALLGSASPSEAVLYFPPFWFLGLYHSLLYRAGAQPIFHHLARTGLAAIVTLTIIATITYPFAYLRRLRTSIEGAPPQHREWPIRTATDYALHITLLRTPRSRAVFHLVAQTLARLQRLHLYMAMYAGLGIALILSGLLAFVVQDGPAGHSLRITISPFGIRSAVPILVFWVVTGLRTVLLSPLGRGGSWLFRTVSGMPQDEDLRGAEIFVQLTAGCLSLLCVATLYSFSPTELRTTNAVLTQFVLAVGLSITLTDLFFLPVQTIPFTTARIASTRDLPFTLVRYLVLFPAFVLTTVNLEPWIESSTTHLTLISLAFIATHFLLRIGRTLLLRHTRDTGSDLYTTLKLRED